VTDPVVRGDLFWVDLSPTRGREQHGCRPALVVSGAEYLQSVPDLVIVVPVTSVDRGWPHHVRVRAPASTLPRASFAMTEQPRTIWRERLVRHTGRADEATMDEVDQWLRDFLQL
jgi:mRNA interferase MazF